MLIRILCAVSWISYLIAGPVGYSRDVAVLFEESISNPVPARIEVYKSPGGNDLKAHIFEPAESAVPRRVAILWIHGGGWKQGSADQLFPQCAYFSELGYVTITIDYRLAGTNGATIFDCIDDCRDAFYWAIENADRLGIDPERIVVAGESAGGHLAACIGYIRDSRPGGIPSPQPWPVATIPINPVMDMTTISWAMQVPGLTPDDLELARSISPIFHIDATSVPALLLHGASDSVVPPEQSSDFADAMHSRGGIASLRLWQGKSHAFFLYLPQFNLVDKDIIHFSLLEIEAFLQSLGLSGYPSVQGHFSPVHLFDGADGFRSFSELVLIGEKLYGSTYKGGTNDNGVVFCFAPATRAYQVLHEFDGPDGREIFTGLATDGSRIYGVGKFGGTHDQGALFSMKLDGSDFEVLHHFNDTDNSGYGPHAAPVLADGILYGTTYHGGVTTYGGALYKYPLPSGPYQLIHSFDASTGRHPTGQLIRIGDWLYGTASDLFEHDSGFFGSLFRIRISDFEFEVLHHFNGTTDGSHPYDDLLYDGMDRLIGTTLGKAFDPSSKGTIFSYSISSDTLTVLHDFEMRPGTGSKPNSALITGANNDQLYGISHGSNAVGGDLGTLFRIDTDGNNFQLYHVFRGGLSGNTPMRSLCYHGGAYYGVTAFGGLTANVNNPETGPGFIFRYQPVPLSVEKESYVSWLSKYDLLINQFPDNDLEHDGFSLVEEFCFNGNPLESDMGTPFEYQITDTGLFKVVFPVVRSEMSSALLPIESTDLFNWTVSSGFVKLLLNNPSSEPGFETLSFEWPVSKFEEDPFYLKFAIAIPN